MDYLKSIRKILSERNLLILFLASFVLWIFLFRGFLSNTLALHGDASSYYSHVKFYLDNIRRGVYPMWEATRQSGIPAELFMRRIGSFNPLFFLILVLDTVGLSYVSSYFLFLALYYFLGMVGFYLLARRILRDSAAAFVAYLLLMFSSLGARLFDSYILLTIIPMIWFFYFLLAFSQEQKRHFLLGVTFAAMILMTTYVPFYFITIFLVFFICGLILYFRDARPLLVRYAAFFKNNKLFTWFCVFAFALSLIPGILMYMEGERGQIVIPGRHYEAPSENTFAVHTHRVTEGGVTPTIISDDLSLDSREIKLDTLYIPVFAYILFLFSIITRFDKRIVLFAMAATVLFIISITDLTPVYQFLYAHVFYFKLIRNLHYFIWFALLPVFILVASEQLRIVLRYELRTRIQKYALFIFLIIIHLGAILFIWHQRSAAVGSYIAVFLSLLFFVFYFSGRLKAKNPIFLLLLFAIITIQPIETFGYLSCNAGKTETPYPGTYRSPEKPFLRLKLPKADSIRDWLEQGRRRARAGSLPGSQRILDINVGMKWYIFLRQHPSHVFDHYSGGGPLLVYDRIERIDDSNLDMKKITKAFMENRNVAFVSSGDSSDVADEGIKKYAPQVQAIARDSKEVQVLKVDVNLLKLKTNFKTRKFLVYNDNFHKGWRAFINGKETDIVRANIAFKGIWLPPGENVVYFRFGEPWRYAFNLFMVWFFAGVFLYLLFEWRRYMSARYIKSVNI